MPAKSNASSPLMSSLTRIGGVVVPIVIAVYLIFSQANFLINCGLVDLMGQATLAQRGMAHRLIAEHEMGELFKVLALHRGPYWDALGFREGDRTHTL